MASSRKRKREPTEEGKGSSRHGSDLSLHAFEAVISPNAQQRLIKLASGKHQAASSTGLIEWDLPGITEKAILVDRYDARLLLDSLPAVSRSQELKNVDPGDGWDDLPSDCEDLFFLNLEEAEDIRREKKRRLVELDREVRLLAIKASDTEEEPANTWGGSDEEPEESVIALMSKTATYIASSPNAVQLEMRILANHGGDARFAFLRGRWRCAWQAAKDSSKSQPVPNPTKVPTAGGLVTYDSEEDEAGEGDHKPVSTEGLRFQAPVDDAKIKADRRARAKEWSRKRKENGSV